MGTTFIRPRESSLSGGEGARFQETLWHQVFRAGGTDSLDSSKALENLCSLYWCPIYSFLRRRGNDRQGARDLTQGFFLYLLEKKLIEKADPEKGRFRSFLLATLKFYVSNENQKARAQRRGGGAPPLSLDETTAEGLYQCEPSENYTPEKLFERRWAQTVLDQAMKRSAEEYGKSRQDQFLALQPLLLGDRESSYAELSKRIGKTEGAIRIEVHRLKQRYKALVRETIRETVLDEDLGEQEYQHLKSVLRER